MDQLVGYLIAAVLGVIGTIAAARILEKRPDLRYQISSSGDLVPHDAKVQLEINYRGDQVRHLVQIRCTFVNRGSQPVEAVAFDWSTKTAGRLVYWNCEDPRYAETSAGTQGKIVLLNPRERTSCEWLFADDPKPEVSIVARGVGIVARPETSIRFEWLVWIAGIPALILGGVFSLLFKSSIEAAFGEVVFDFVNVVVLIAFFLGMLSVAITYGRRRL